MIAGHELNGRGVPTPSGGKWHATQVMGFSERLSMLEGS
jgi:hypothetical protein